MEQIKKAKETMSSKERVLRTFAFQETDRVPIDYSANPAIHARFCKTLGVDPNDYRTLFDRIGADYWFTGARFVGENRFPVLRNRKTDPIYGFNMRWAENENGGYWDFCDFPLQGADDETIANFHVPGLDDFSVETLRKELKPFAGRAIAIGGAGTADIINSTGRGRPIPMAPTVNLQNEKTL